jgi:adenylate cyclase
VSNARKRLLIEWLALTFIGVLFLPIFYFITRSVGREDIYSIAIASPSGALLLLWLKHGVSPVLKRMPFLAALVGFSVVVFTGFALIVGLAVWTSSALNLALSPFDSSVAAETARRLSFEDPHLKIGVSIIASLFWVGLVITLISRKLGRGVLWNWITGKYHKPRQEERVFMMADLNSSTSIAERLGDMRFSELLKDFFGDVGEAIADTGGEVSHYVGDEVVISWPLKRGLSGARCVQCAWLARQNIEKRASYYQTKYGYIPTFKAGIHAGTVVVTEVGDQKSEIVFHGDVLNTTARIENACKEAGTYLLLSAAVAQMLVKHADVELLPAGAFNLRGKESRVELFVPVGADHA